MSTFEWIVSVGGGLIAPFALVAIIGCFLPRRHTVVRSIVLKVRPETVWDTISSFERLPAWWPPCLMIERLPDRNGRPVYRETFMQGRRKHPIMVEVTEAVAPTRLATSIVDERGPFRGSWIIVVQSEAAGTRVTLTEHGEVANPFIRTMFRLTVSKTQFVDSYLICLGRKFGEKVLPQ